MVSITLLGKPSIEGTAAEKKKCISVKYKDPDELPDSQEMKRYRTSDSTVQIVVLLSISGSLRVLMSPLDGFRH